MMIPDRIDEDDAVLLTDACPTGYQAAEMGDIKEGDSVVVFGAGPVGLFAAKSAWLMGAGRVIVVDHLDYRLEMAREFAQCRDDELPRGRRHRACTSRSMTDWLGADVCIDAVGCRGRRARSADLTTDEAQDAGRRADRAELGDRLRAQGRQRLHRRRLRAALQRRARSATR